MSEEPKIGKTIIDDWKRGGIKQSLKRDFAELKHYFLNDERKRRLVGMNSIKRWFFTTVWLLKVLILKLTPARRILLVIAIILIFISRDTGNDSQNIAIVAGLFFLFIIMLELKDKMLARDELEAGRSVQRALLPDQQPEVAGWSLWLFTRPANEVGGDLVDFIKLSKNKFGIALGDVAGKGLGAALFMAKLQSILRALAPDFDSLSQMGSKLNEIFHREGVPNKFASMLFIEMSENSNNIRFINAGHLPPILIQQNKIREFPKGAPALGLLPKADYSETPVNFEKDDILLVYSDGLTEAQNGQGEFFGNTRLSNLLLNITSLSAQEVGEKLIKKIDNFIGEAKSADDISIIVLKCEI